MREMIRWKVPWQGPVTFVLALLGIGISIYLTIVHYDTAIQVSCPATGAIDCAAVITSPQSVILGLPVAVYGLAWFVGMTVLFSPWAWNTSSPQLSGYKPTRIGKSVGILRLAGVLSAICFVIYLIWVEAFAVHKICLWCSSVHLITFVLLIIVITSSPWSLGQVWQDPEED